MEDSRDTVIVTGIGEIVTGDEFINLFHTVGEIKTESKTGQRMAIMRYTKDGTREGIVTYKDPSVAEQAVKQLNGVLLGTSDVNVLMAEQYFLKHANVGAQQHLPVMYGQANTAWRLWQTNVATAYPKGGKGGEGGGFGFFRGQDGQPGEDGYGGKGGEGGKGGCDPS